MDTVPQRNTFLTLYRIPLAWIERNLKWLPFNANQLTALGVILSVVFLFVAHSFPLNVLLIALILFLDALDGMASRKEKHPKPKPEGYIIDTTYDRLSEGFLSIPYINTGVGKFFFILFLINIFLDFVAIKTGKHYLLAHRFFLLVYLLYVGLTT